MRLINSYLHEVGRYLPEAQRADILDELRLQLEEEVRESAGAEPSREQIEVVLNRYGHPINVASGYKEPRFLIGPELYPAFVETLSTVFIISLAAVVSLQLLVWVMQGWSTGISGLVYKAVSLSFWLTGATVITFATLEYYGERVGWYDSWKASQLSERDPIPFNRSDVLTNVVTEGIFLLWWGNVLRLQNWLEGSDWRFSVSLSDAWTPIYWPIFLVVAAWFVLHVATLLANRWYRLTVAAELCLNAAALMLCAYLVVQPELVYVTGAVEGIDLIERSVKVSLLVIAAVIAWDTWEAIKRWQTVSR